MSVETWQRIVHSVVIIAGVWKIGELVLEKVIAPIDRWQAERYMSRERSAEWAGKRRRLD